jgi:hypothetical protein
MRLTIRQRQRRTHTHTTQLIDATHANATQPTDATHRNATQLVDATHTKATQQGIFGNATHWHTTSGTRISRRRQRAAREFMQHQVVDNLGGCTKASTPDSRTTLEGQACCTGDLLLTVCSSCVPETPLYSRCIVTPVRHTHSKNKFPQIKRLTCAVRHTAGLACLQPT